MTVINIILADAAVSLVPEQWYSNRAIKSYMNRYNRPPLIDGSKHQHLLQDIPLDQRKDRPDILHFALLTALGFSDVLDELSLYFTTDDTWYHVSADTRLPRAQNRFYGILEQLLAGDSNNPFIYPVDHITIEHPDTIFFSSTGRDLQPSDLRRSNFVFGSFAHGGYKSLTPGTDNVVNLADAPIEVWTALSLFFGKVID